RCSSWEFFSSTTPVTSSKVSYSIKYTSSTLSVFMKLSAGESMSLKILVVHARFPRLLRSRRIDARLAPRIRQGLRGFLGSIQRFDIAAAPAAIHLGIGKGSLSQAGGGNMPWLWTLCRVPCVLASQIGHLNEL